MDNYNQKFDYLIREFTKKLTAAYADFLGERPEFSGNIDTSPLLNMTLSVYMSSLMNVLDGIEKMTVGELKLMENIRLSKSTLMKAIMDLPFVTKVDEI
jgi:hypothetical protein